MPISKLSSREFNQHTSRAKKAARRGPVIITALSRSRQDRTAMDFFPPDLLCPRDASRLAIRQWGPAWYGFCERCGGIWIGRGELEELVEHSSAPLATYPEGDFRILEDTALCSCTGQPLMNRVTRDEVSIDVCPACQAIWFDAGEIQCILAAEREAELRRGLPPITPPPAGPLEEAGRVFDLLDLVVFVFRVFGSVLR